MSSLARLTRRQFAAVSAALAGGIAAGNAAYAQEAPADRIVIFHTNDVHGYLSGDGESVVGIDLVAGLKATEENFLLVDAGDFTQGKPLASTTKGQACVELMNAAGYDAAALGNHEFDFGVEQLLANAQGCEFPLLAANVVAESGGHLLAGVQDLPGDACDGRTCVLECGGRRIGFFGLVTNATATEANPTLVAGVEFLDEVAMARECIAELAAQDLDAVVALCHLGSTGDGHLTASRLVEALPPEAAAVLTAVVDGHSHTVENDVVNGVLVVQTGSYGSAVGKLELVFCEDGSVSATEELLDAAAVAAQAEPDPAVAAVLADVNSTLDSLYATAICQNPTTLWGPLNGTVRAARNVETNLGDVIARAFYEAMSDYIATNGLESLPMVSVENGGGLRADLRRGIVSMGDLVTTFPFSNTVQLKQVTPAVLYRMFENSAQDMAALDPMTGTYTQISSFGGFLQAYGCTVEFDPGAEQGSRVLSVTLDGMQEPLDRSDEETPILIVTNNYLMSGGNGYDDLAGRDLLADMGGELEVLTSYLDGLSGGAEGSLPIFAGTEGNLVLRGGYEPAPYMATIRLVDGAGNPVPDTEVTLEIDASDQVACVADGEGYVAVMVEDGPHAVAVAGQTPEVYVNNYLGLGLVEDENRPFPQLVVQGSVPMSAT